MSLVGTTKLSQLQCQSIIHSKELFTLKRLSSSPMCDYESVTCSVCHILQLCCVHKFSCSGWSSAEIAAHFKASEMYFTEPGVKSSIYVELPCSAAWSVIILLFRVWQKERWKNVLWCLFLETAPWGSTLYLQLICFF